MRPRAVTTPKQSETMKALRESSQCRSVDPVKGSQVVLAPSEVAPRGEVPTTQVAKPSLRSWRRKTSPEEIARQAFAVDDPLADADEVVAVDHHAPADGADDRVQPGAVSAAGEHADSHTAIV